MASYMRGMLCLVSIERNVCVSKMSSVFVESRRFVRGLRRKPVRVLFPETVNTKTPRSDQEQLKMKRDKETKVRFSPDPREEKDSFMTKRDTTSPVKPTQVSGARDQLGGLRFERASAGDKRLGRLVSIARSRTFREQQGKILLEGRRLICDALDAGANPQMVFFSTVDRLQELPLDKLKRATLVKVKFEDIKLWSDLIAPQGVIAIFSRPDPTRLNFVNREQSMPLSLICDNVRDPGNLGTMLRCAVAAGCRNVLLTKGCVDAWEPKVLRAAMGAHFRLPIHPSVEWNDIASYLPDHVTVHVADSSCAFPESTETEVNARKPSKAGDYGWVSNNKNMHYDSDLDSESDSDDEALSTPRVETMMYHESWAQSPTALVIGGETHGLSREALRLAEESEGRRLYIPVAPGVDSLNSAMAAGILLFEGRKQLKMLQTSGKKRQPKAERQHS